MAEHIISFDPRDAADNGLTVDRAQNIPLAEKRVDTGQNRGIRQYADAPAARVSLKEKLEAMKVRAAGGDRDKPAIQKEKNKEETL